MAKPEELIAEEFARIGYTPYLIDQNRIRHALGVGLTATEIIAAVQSGGGDIYRATQAFDAAVERAELKQRATEQAGEEAKAAQKRREFETKRNQERTAIGFSPLPVSGESPAQRTGFNSTGPLGPVGPAGPQDPATYVDRGGFEATTNEGGDENISPEAQLAALGYTQISPGRWINLAGNPEYDIKPGDIVDLTKLQSGGGGSGSGNAVGFAQVGENARQFDIDHAEGVRQFDLKFGRANFESDRTYQQAREQYAQNFAEDQRQFDTSQSGINARFYAGEEGQNQREAASQTGQNQRAQLNANVQGFQSVNQLIPQLGDLALKNAGFTRDVTTKPADFVARAHMTRGGTSPLPVVSQADLINQLRTNIQGFNSALAGFQQPSFEIQNTQPKNSGVNPAYTAMVAANRAKGLDELGRPLPGFNAPPARAAVAPAPAMSAPGTNAQTQQSALATDARWGPGGAPSWLNTSFGGDDTSAASASAGGFSGGGAAAGPSAQDYADALRDAGFTGDLRSAGIPGFARGTFDIPMPDEITQDQLRADELRARPPAISDILNGRMPAPLTLGFQLPTAMQYNALTPDEKEAFGTTLAVQHNVGIDDFEKALTDRFAAPTGRGMASISGFNEGGFTREPMFVGNEEGAELFVNPTNAPIMVVPADDTKQMGFHRKTKAKAK